MSKAWLIVIVSSFLICGTAFAADSDGDGLSDSVESSLGSSPLHKDIFVEIDWFIVNGRSYKPRPGFVEFVQSIFASAPVLNPDGTYGIRIHIELSQGIRTNRAVLGFTNSDGADSYNWSEFDVYKALYFTPSKRNTHHYCLFIADYGDKNGKASTSSGLSRNGKNFQAGASDLIVSLGDKGWWNHPNPGNYKYTQAGTFVHELGHNMGLKHGGNDHYPYKPNHLSLMNYTFQTDGVPYTRLDGVRFRIFDYSRFFLPALNENRLNEAFGLGPYASDIHGVYGTTWHRYIGRWQDYTTWNATSNVDWNQDRRINTSVRTNITVDNRFNSIPTTQEWRRLNFKGGWIGKSGLAAASTLPMETTLRCLHATDLPKRDLTVMDTNVRYGSYMDIFKK